MAIKQWSAGEQVSASDLNNNFAQTLQTQNYTAGETITAGQAVYLKGADGRVWKADADASESLDNFIGIALEGGDADDTIMVQTEGLVTGLSGLTAGSFYYVSSTAGALATTGLARIGLAISTTTLLLQKINNTSKFITITTATGTTLSLTTLAGQKVIVWAKGVFADNNTLDISVYLKYNGVTKDTCTMNIPTTGATYKYPFALMYTETPGAGTQNITVETTADSIANVVIIAQVIG